MNDEEERKFWLAAIAKLREKFTLEHIAEKIGVSVRQVSNWQYGDKPKGMNAVRLYTFHAKHGTPVHRTAVHVQEEEKPVAS